MNSTLENFGKVAAAISVAVVTLSVANEWGYFYVIGGEFQKFESASDYLSNAIGWLPYLILYLFGWGVWASYQFVVAAKHHHTPSDVFNVSLALVAFIIILYAWPNLGSATAWPMLFAYLLIILWSISAIVFFRKFSETANNLLLGGVHAAAQFVARSPEGGIKLGFFYRHVSAGC